MLPPSLVHHMKLQGVIWALRRIADARIAAWAPTARCGRPVSGVGALSAVWEAEEVGRMSGMTGRWRHCPPPCSGKVTVVSSPSASGEIRYSFQSLHFSVCVPAYCVRVRVVWVSVSALRAAPPGPTSAVPADESRVFVGSISETLPV